jgi:hypothetical protein
MHSCLIIYLLCLKEYSSAPWIGYPNSKSWLYSWNYFYSIFKHVLIVPTKCTMCIYYIHLFYFSCIFRCHVHHHQGELFYLLLKTDVIKLNIYCHGTAHLHNRLVCRHDIHHVINDEHNKIITVVLAKHEIGPWWWFLRGPKHVGAIIGILIVFNIPVIL